jgi:hypothetical protein
MPDAIAIMNNTTINIAIKNIAIINNAIINNAIVKTETKLYNSTYSIISMNSMNILGQGKKIIYFVLGNERKQCRIERML